MFIIYIIEIYVCLIIYLFSNIVILVEKIMIGIYMRNKFGVFFLLMGFELVKVDLLYMNWCFFDCY